MWQHWSSPLGEVRPGPHDSAGAHLDREVRSRAEKHMAASEFSSQRGRARSHGTRGNVEAHLGREARSGAEERVAVDLVHSVVVEQLPEHDLACGSEPAWECGEGEAVAEQQPPRASGCEAAMSSRG
jgi:hypothetical protein